MSRARANRSRDKSPQRGDKGHPLWRVRRPSLRLTNHHSFTMRPMTAPMTSHAHSHGPPHESMTPCPSDFTRLRQAASFRFIFINRRCTSHLDCLVSSAIVSSALSSSLRAVCVCVCHKLSRKWLEVGCAFGSWHCARIQSSFQRFLFFLSSPRTPSIIRI